MSGRGLTSTESIGGDFQHVYVFLVIGSRMPGTPAVTSAASGRKIRSRVGDMALWNFR